MADDKDFSKMKLPDLKKELKARGLKTTGNKNELVERLLEAESTGGVNVDSMEELDEDVLIGDELEDDLKSVKSIELDGGLSSGDQSFEISQTHDGTDCNMASKPKLTRPKLFEQLEPEPSTTDDILKSPRKISLKRASYNAEVSTSEPDKKNNTSADEEPKKKIIKISDISMKERLEMRAKKFGTNQTTVSSSTNTKLLARSQRFGVEAAPVATQSNSNLDALKKRAERFGVQVSTVLKKHTEQEALEKRQARFGNPITANASLSESDKKKLRLERFKTAA